ncbi:hypothetical protein M8J77_021383 [Diaphorina citri]|nr:hypothetical protein M8J77_021383 [Diaphorina citri]
MHTNFKPINLKDVHTYVLTSNFSSGLDKVPNSASGRLTVLVTSITCLFLVTAYAANIVVLIQTPSSLINTVTDLANSPFTVKLHEFQHNRAFLRDVKKDPKLNREAKYLYDKKLLGHSENELFVNASTGIENIRQPLYAFLVALENFAYFYIKQTWREEEKCGLSELRAFPRRYMVLPVHKQSGYCDLFAQKYILFNSPDIFYSIPQIYSILFPRYILFREVGLIRQATQQWLGTKPECRSGNAAQFVSIGITEFVPALKIYAVGIAAALLVFIGERIKFTMERELRRSSNLAPCKKKKLRFALVSPNRLGAHSSCPGPPPRREGRQPFPVQAARVRLPCV